MEEGTVRSVILAMQTSLDGYVAGEDGELEWIFPDFADDLLDALEARLLTIDTVLMGRENYLEQAAYWPEADDRLAPVVNAQEKIVFSTTLEDVRWQGARLATGTPTEEIARLRQTDGGDIGVSGGARFARSVLDAGLVDVVQLTVHPIALGAGIPLFDARRRFALQSSLTFASGTVMNVYRAH